MHGRGLQLKRTERTAARLSLACGPLLGTAPPAGLSRALVADADSLTRADWLGVARALALLHRHRARLPVSVQRACVLPSGTTIHRAKVKAFKRAQMG